MKKLGDYLRESRQLRGYKQIEVAEIANIPATVISHWESGKRTPSLDNLIKLAETYRVSLDYLVGRSAINTAPASTKIAELFNSLTAQEYTVFIDLLEAFVHRKHPNALKVKVIRRAT